MLRQLPIVPKVIVTGTIPRDKGTMSCKRESAIVCFGCGSVFYVVFHSNDTLHII